MTSSKKLTAEVLLGAPRRGAPLPNANGNLALYTLSTHKFGDKTIKEVRIMDLDTKSTSQLIENEKASDANWIPGTEDEVVYLKSLDKGKTEILVANAKDASKEHYVVGEVEAPIGDLKLKSLGDGSVAFVVTGQVGDDGKLYNEEAVEKKSTGRIFDTALIHIWNKLCSAQRLSLWTTKLVREDGKWKLQGSLVNAIQDDTLLLHGQDDDSMDISSNFDISPRGIAFVARDLTEKRPYHNLMTAAYFVAIDDFTKAPTQKPSSIPTPNGVGIGSHSNIKFTPDATQIGYLYTQANSTYEARLYITPVESLDKSADVIKHLEIDYTSYDPMEGFEFAGSSDSLLFTNQRHGRHILSRLSLTKKSKPTLLFTGGGIAGFQPLREDSWDKLLVASSSYVENSLWQIISSDKAGEAELVSSASDHGAKFQLSPSMVTEIWFPGADDVKVHSWIIRPSDFDEKKKYPWVFIPHGGPEAAHIDAWSTRWNLAAWAEQGYVIVAPNFTGSTGFGLEFLQRIMGEWGGRPFTDCLKLLEHCETLPYLDQGKAVLAGASYGGYMTSWFMGDKAINKFCCAIWHDGIYSLPIANMQDDAYFEDASNPSSIPVWPWQNAEELDRWDPAQPQRLANWKHAPPTLIIHSDKDFRCNVADGLAMVKTLHAQGVPTRYLNFPDEGHWVLKAENSKVWHETVWGWMKKCVDGEVKRGDKKW